MSDDSGFSIEVNEKHTRIADIKAANNKLELAALGFVDTAPFYYSSDNQSILEKESELISKLHSNLRIKKRDAHVIIPDIYTFSRIVEMPKLKEKELLAAIRYQADEFIPMDINETNLDLEILKEDTQANKVLIYIVASPKKLVEKIQKTIELANLVPHFLENELSAVARMVSTFLSKPKTGQSGTTVLINFGYSTTSLYLFDETNTVLLLSRSFKIGLSLFIKDITTNLNIDETKAITALRTVGVDPQASINLDLIITPLIKEISREIERFMMVSKDKYGLAVSDIHIFNYDTSITYLQKKLQEGVSVQIHSLTLSDRIAENPIKQSFSATLSSFITVISGGI